MKIPTSVPGQRKPAHQEQDRPGRFECGANCPQHECAGRPPFNMAPSYGGCQVEIARRVSRGTFGDPCQKMLAEGVFGLFNCGTGQGGPGSTSPGGFLRRWTRAPHPLHRDARRSSPEIPVPHRGEHTDAPYCRVWGCIQSVGGGRSRLRPIVSGADGGTNESRSGRHALTFAPGLTRLDFTTQTITIG